MVNILLLDERTRNEHSLPLAAKAERNHEHSMNI